MVMVQVVVGIAVLILGRQLFWLFVGAVGFSAGMILAAQFFGPEMTWTIVALALVAGILGAIISFFLQRVAVGLAGFAAGAYLGYHLFTLLALAAPEWSWVALLAGGIIGAILVIALFGWALILLSSLVGAGLVVGAFPLEPAVQALLFLFLLLAGIAFQAQFIRGK